MKRNEMKRKNELQAMKISEKQKYYDLQKKIFIENYCLQNIKIIMTQKQHFSSKSFLHHLYSFRCL